MFGLLSMASPILSSFLGGNEQQDAADAQSQAAQAGIEEQRRQFDTIRELLKPYVNAGTATLGDLSTYGKAGLPALQGQQALLGLLGNEEQQNAINNIQNSPFFSAMAQQGENAILQNASATGGLRGGNVQAALAQFRPQLLNQLVDQQYSRLGGLAGMGNQTLSGLAQLGQNAAAGTGTAGMQSGDTIAKLMQQQGAAQAGGYLAKGKMYNNLANIGPQILGMMAGGMPMFG